MAEGQSVDRICFDVVANVSAIVTHEVNNALAIINENAGYIDDLVQMVGEEGQLPAGRVMRGVSPIPPQIRRANRLMKDLNRLAHSGDARIAAIDLAESLQVMINLTGRKAAAAEVAVSMQSVEPLVVTTRPQLIYALNYICLTGLYGLAGAGGAVDCEVSGAGSQADGALLRFQVGGAMSGNIADIGDNSALVTILDALNAELQVADDAVVVTVPATSW